MFPTFIFRSSQGCRDIIIGVNIANDNKVWPGVCVFDPGHRFGRGGDPEENKRAGGRESDGQKNHVVRRASVLGSGTNSPPSPSCSEPHPPRRPCTPGSMPMMDTDHIPSFGMPPPWSSSCVTATITSHTLLDEVRSTRRYVSVGREISLK